MIVCRMTVCILLRNHTLSMLTLVMQHNEHVTKMTCLMSLRAFAEV